MFKGRTIIYSGIIFIIILIILASLRSLLNYRVNYVVDLMLLIFFATSITYRIIKVKKTKEKTEYNLMKKEKIRLINMLVFIVAVIIIFLTPFFQSTWFYLRHIVFFILIAFLLCFNGYVIGVNAMRRSPDKAKTLKFVSLGSVMIGLLVFGNLQLFYIENYEIPPLLGCSYYDDYGNLIYNSQIAGSCPELENLEKTVQDNGSVLSFSVHEEINRYDDETFDYLVKGKYTYDSTIEYQYDDLNRVTRYTINLTTKGYAFDLTKQEDVLYRTTVYNKTIENTYEDRRFTSNHKVVNMVSDNEHIFEVLSYNYDIDYISELKPKEDSDNYVIEVNKVVHNDDGVTNKLLYSIDVLSRESEDDYSYIINKTDREDYVVIRVDDRDEDWNVITRDYRSNIYERMRTEKEQYFENHKTLSQNRQRIYTNDFTRYDPYIGHDVDFQNNYIIKTHSGEIFNQGFYNFTNIIEDKEYGFKISHYHLERERDFSYKKYDATVFYNIDSPNNPLSIDLQTINNYEQSLYYPDFYKMELVYQDNPLLMRTFIEELNNK